MEQDSCVSVEANTTKVCVSGASGKMGLEVVDLIENDADFNQDFTAVCGIYRNSAACTLPKVDGHNFDVIIDFSTPECAMIALRLADKNQTPIVVGTTGFSDVQIDEISRVAQNIPVFLCSNLSRTMHVFKQHAVSLAQTLPADYDIEVIDIHHKNKIDAPSGTALTLLEALSKTRNAKILAEKRFANRVAKDQNEIGIASIRSGEDLIGEHRIIFASKYDRIEIMHRSSSRKIYIQGALDAAKWLLDKPSGLYDMDDMM